MNRWNSVNLTHKTTDQDLLLQKMKTIQLSFLPLVNFFKKNNWQSNITTYKRIKTKFIGIEKRILDKQLGTKLNTCNVRSKEFYNQNFFKRICLNGFVEQVLAGLLRSQLYFRFSFQFLREKGQILFSFFFFLFADSRQDKFQFLLAGIYSIIGW